MATYKVTYTETLKKEVFIEAETQEEAEKKAWDMYYKTQVVLSADDFVDTVVSLVPVKQKVD